MNASDILEKYTENIISRYRRALEDSDSPLTSSSDCWQECRLQAGAVIAECIEVLRSGSAPYGDLYARTRQLGINRAMQRIPVSHSVRAGTLLWRSAVSTLREGLPDNDNSQAVELAASMDALGHAIGIRLYIGAVAHEHAFLASRTAALFKPAAKLEDTESPDRNGTGKTTLTARELQVLEGVAQGLSNQAIARKLGTAEATIKSHLRKIFRKLDATSRVDALNKAQLRLRRLRLHASRVCLGR